MTDEIFRRDGYVSEFEAEVVSVDGEWVVFGGTAFFPGGGGQVHDTGTAGGFPVVEVDQKSGEIRHRIPGHPFSPGDRIWCSVDWDRRYDLMKGHTAEHILFHYIQEEDEETQIVKINITPEGKSVIISKDVPWDLVMRAVEKANKAVSENHPVVWLRMEKDDPEMSNVRAKLERIDGEVVTVAAIGDVDLAACSGIHVMETGEIGQIFVDRKVSAGKDGVSVYFSVGDEALNKSNALAYGCLQAIEALDSKPGDFLKTIENTKRELESLRKSVREMSRALLSAIEPTVVGDVAVYQGIFHADRDSMTETAERIRNEGNVAVFVGAGDNVSVMASSGESRVDCKKLLSDVLPKFGGRGGGKPGFAQGGAAGTDPEKLLKALLDGVRGMVSG